MYEMDGCEYRGNYNDIALHKYSNKNDVFLIIYILLKIIGKFSTYT